MFAEAPTSQPPPGWHIDPDTGAWMRDTVHHMGRRCLKWNYCWRGVYHITLVLNDRARPLFGRLVGDSEETARIELSELGSRVEAHFKRLPEFTPEIEVLGVQVMPEHLHGVLRVTREMKKSLGEQLRGFKMGATKIAREMGLLHRPMMDGTARAEDYRGKGLFADGFVDVILHDDKAIESELAYVRDNPRRLWAKRAHPELFKVLCDLRQRLTINGQVVDACFAAIGNQALLRAPTILQVQCSRSYFDYARDAKGKPLHTLPPRVKTPEFDEKLATLMAAADHGAVLVSPCISPGEREIARRAFEAGRKVITLANKGFSPLYKPGGKLFDRCAEGNLLMLAPAGWPYLPGEKKMTRVDACILNRIAQLLAGDGAVEINYKGARLGDVDSLVRDAVVNS